MGARIVVASLLGALVACSSSSPGAGQDAAAQQDATVPQQDASAPQLDGGAGEDAVAEDALAEDAGEDGGVQADGPLSATCLAQGFQNPDAAVTIDYDQFQPVIGSHCKGTNHQDITGVERVVFLGDSVTVGTPPTSASQVYRAILAEQLATHFGIAAPGPLWDAVDLINGVALQQSSGAFACCAKWGARTDDLMRDSHQVEDCIPPEKRNLHHLVVITMGGNDFDAITKDGGGTSPAKTIPELWQDTYDFVDLMRQTVAWLKDPVNMPGGADVVFTNLHEFTDATGDVDSCPGAALAGIQPWTDHQAQVDMAVWIAEQYLKIAVDYQADMVFMLEHFCGHGYRRDDATGPCYRGPNQEMWLDLTCIHPSPAGHAALADLFFSTIAE